MNYISVVSESTFSSLFPVFMQVFRYRCIDILTSTFILSQGRC